MRHASGEKFTRERDVRLGAFRLRVVTRHRQAVTWRFREPHVARNDGLKHFLLEKLAHVRRDLRAQIGALVVHRQQHAVDVERRIQSRAHTAQGSHQIRKPFQREVLAVQRDQHCFGGDECIERQQAEGRRAVDEDVIEAIAQRREEPA